MKIAAYLDSQDQPASLYQPGRLVIFENATQEGEGRWCIRSSGAFTGSDGMSLEAMKMAVYELSRSAGDDCRVLLSGAIGGLPYSILQESYGFRTWKSEGALQQQLDFVCEREQALLAQKKYELVRVANQTVPAPLLLQSAMPGHYWIDLRAALEHPSNPTSRNILIPFLSAGRFVRLDVVCGHLPKWMAWELERLDLAACIEEVDATGNEIRAVVYSRLTPEGRALKPGLLGADAMPRGLSCPREAQRSAIAMTAQRPKILECSAHETH